MKRMLEVQGKKENDAIADGLKQLGLTLDDVDVKIISAGGFLKKAKVEIYYEVPDESVASVPSNANSASSAPVKAPLKAKEGALSQNKEREVAVPERTRNDGEGKFFVAKNEKNAPVAKNEIGGSVKNENKGVLNADKTVKSENKPQEKQNVQPLKNNVVAMPAEPHWGAPANFNPEPTVKANFGKSELKAEGESAGESVKEPFAAKSADRNQNGNYQNANNRNGQRPNRNNNKNRNNNDRRGNNNGAQNNAEGRQNDRPFAERGDRNNQNAKRERETVDPTPEQAEDAVAFLKALLEKMNISAQVENKIDDGLRINLVTEDSRIIGYRGEVLDSLQYLVSLRVNKTDDKFVHVSLDGLDYRNKRKGTLESLATRMAEKAVSTGKKISMEPMNSADRRIIHAALGEASGVITRSEGREPMRHIVILPKKE